MIKNLQESRNKFDEIFNNLEETLIIEFLNDEPSIRTIKLGDNGISLYNRYGAKIENLVDLYRSCPELIDSNKEFNDLFTEFLKSILEFSLDEVKQLFLKDLEVSYTNKNTIRVLGIAPYGLESNKYAKFYIKYNIRVDGKYRNISEPIYYRKIDLLRRLYEL